MVESLANEDRKAPIWWATPVECQSAVFKRYRESASARELLDQALARLNMILEDAATVPATDDLRERARRLVATHPLRAADALQLAAALVWCEERPSDERFVCLHDRLREAARREGFTVLPA